MKYCDIQIGMTKENTHLITQEDVNKFADLTGDDNKLHLDEKYASKTSFKKPVAHGMLSASFISTIIGTEIPGDGALWFSQTIDFLIPVRVGDLITVKATVLKKDDRNNAIEMSTDIYNQNKEQVLRGTAKVKIIEPVNDEPKTKKIEKEKYALVIGATGGIGSETCIKLAASGFNLLIHYHGNKEKAQNIKNKVIEYGMDAYVFKANINEQKEVDSMFLSIKNRVPYINTFVNCATIRLPSISFEDLDWSEIEKNININIKSNFYIVKNLLPIFKFQKKGKIIFISTLYTEGTPPQGMLAYVSAKSALNGFSKSLAIELAKYNITVNMVSPGMTDTDLISNVPEKYKILMAAKTPLKRLSSVQDVAEAIVFLSSDGANYITGETIRINGGQIMI